MVGLFSRTPKDLQLKKNEEQFKKFKKLVKEKKNNNLLIKELEKSSKKLNQLISRLENKINYGEGLDIIDKKGSLLPPVKGKFLNKFGRGRDEKYNSDIIYKLRGYNTPAQIEIWLKLFKDQKYKSIKSQEDFDNFQKSFVAEF